MISIVVSFRQRAAQNTLLNRGVISLPFIRKLGCLVRFFPPGCSTVTPLSSVSLMRRRLIFASSISCVLLLSSCEPATQAKIEGGNPPGYCQLNSRRKDGRDSGKESRFVISSINHCLAANRLFPQTESRFHYCSVTASAVQMSPHSEV